jgi:hypothetical protein
MRQLTSDDYQQFIAAAHVAVIHFDAEWDARYRALTRGSMQEAERVLGQQVEFAEVDIDSNWELAKAVDVQNVALVGYYRDGVLVAALIGCHQDVRTRTERVIRGEPIGYDDGLSTPATSK